MKDPLIELETPYGNPFYFRASDVVSIAAHETNPDQSWIITEKGLHVHVLDNTKSINEFLVKCKIAMLGEE